MQTRKEKEKEKLLWNNGTDDEIIIVKECEDTYLLHNATKNKYGVAWLDGYKWKSYTYTKELGWWEGTLGYVMQWVSRSTAYKRFGELLEQKMWHVELNKSIKNIHSTETDIYEARQNDHETKQIIEKIWQTLGHEPTQNINFRVELDTNMDILIISVGNKTDILFHEWVILNDVPTLKEALEKWEKTKEYKTLNNEMGNDISESIHTVYEKLGSIE